MSDCATASRHRAKRAATSVRDSSDWAQNLLLFANINVIINSERSNQMETKKKGRPSQDKVIRPYTIDRKLSEFIGSLPDGDRSRFVNSIIDQGVALEKLSGKFYNYFLMRPDGSVFYIGKGQGNRINEHEAEARNGAQSHKCNVIRKIWFEGGQVIKQKIAFFDNQEDAYALEILLISFFGRENITNSTDGGEGGSGAPRKGEQVRMRVTRSYSPELIVALEAITTNQSEFVEEWMWEHPLLKERKATRKELSPVE
jgi:hypothetical protein